MYSFLNCSFMNLYISPLSSLDNEYIFLFLHIYCMIPYLPCQHLLTCFLSKDINILVKSSRNKFLSFFFRFCCFLLLILDFLLLCYLLYFHYSFFFVFFFSSCFFPSSFFFSSFCFYHPSFPYFGLHCFLCFSRYLVIFTFLVL